MALHEEEDNHNHKDEKNNKTQSTDTCWNLKRHEFGDHMLCHLASRLVNVIRQGGRQTKNVILYFSVALFYAL